MKVMELRDDWGLDHLRLAERPDPEPGPGQVLIAMKAASINYRDTVMIQSSSASAATPASCASSFSNRTWRSWW